MKRFLYLLIGVALTACTSRPVPVEDYCRATLDSAYMMIGDQLRFRLESYGDADLDVTFPLFDKTIVEGIEVLAGPLRDSTPQKNGKVIISEEYLITSFDSGVYNIPAQRVLVAGEAFNKSYQTEPLQLIVNSFQVDLQKGNFDIVMPKSIPFNPLYLWPWLVGAVVLAGGVWFTLYAIRRRRANRPIFGHQEPQIPPFDAAITALDRLKAESLWQKGEIKRYYTELTDALRTYLNGELGISAMEKTTTEIMDEVKGNALIDEASKARLAELLEDADLVKFAKSAPIAEENERHLENAYNLVHTTNENVKTAAEREAEARAAAAALEAETSNIKEEA